MGELTNSLRKTFASLSSTKYRRELSLFMAQGTKCVLDTIDFFDVETILATSQWVNSHASILDLYDVTVVKRQDIERITTLSSPPEVIAIYHIPSERYPEVKGQLTLALDGVQDPGNLGTIIRVSDWMGVSDIIASCDTVDVWSPKVIQATMGAISRVHVYYCSLTEFIDSHDDVPIYGTFLDGDNIYSSSLSAQGIIVMGNEGKGISHEIARRVDRRLTIPSFPPDRPTSESLNVAVATSIVLSEFRRRI